MHHPHQTHLAPGHDDVVTSTPTPCADAALSPAGLTTQNSFTADPDDRGDVPGWVMITLMSALIVAGLMAIVGPALIDLFNQAIQQVSP